jgi:hypothetical protein
MTKEAKKELGFTWAQVVRESFLEEGHSGRDAPGTQKLQSRSLELGWTYFLFLQFPL